MKRFNSDPYELFDSKSQSTILGGNLAGSSRDIESATSLLDSDSDEEGFSMHEESATSCQEDINSKEVTLEDIKEADKILYSIFGLNIVSVFTHLILKTKVVPTDFVCQALAYKCQQVLRGSHGVRYQNSWGLFWAACRNLLKTRGIIIFRDHFCIPSLSQLSKFKKQIIHMCGLDATALGKSGLQARSIEMWTNSKVKEIDSKRVAVSVCIDGKKISVSKEGTEDMGNIDPKGELDVSLADLVKLWNVGDRPALFAFFDKLSTISYEIWTKILGVKKIEAINTRRLEKNPNMHKYLYILREQESQGRSIARKLRGLQCEVITKIAEKRNVMHLLPSKNDERLHNYSSLIQMTPEEDKKSLDLITKLTRGTFSLLDVRWSLINDHLKNISTLDKRSETFSKIVELCYISSDQIFAACGLCTFRPLQDMKNAYEQSHNFPSKLSLPEATDELIVRSFCSSFAPMTFGGNFRIVESGIFIQDGVCSTPALLVVDQLKVVEYAVTSCKAKLQN